MKKLVSLALCLVLALGVVEVSQAALFFDYHGNQTSGYPLWTRPGESEPSTSGNWNLSWLYYGLGPDNRAVVWVFTEGGKKASSTWVYSYPSTKSHPYKKGIAVGTKVVLKGRMDDRDNGFVHAGGYLHP